MAKSALLLVVTFSPVSSFTSIPPVAFVNVLHNTERRVAQKSGFKFAQFEVARQATHVELTLATLQKNDTSWRKHPSAFERNYLQPALLGDDRPLVTGSQEELSTMSTGGWEITTNQARVLLLMVAAVYGTNFASVKMIDETLPPSAGAAFRFLLASACLVIWK